MSTFVLANFINTTLAAASASGSTSMTLASSAGLPTLSAGQVMPLTINDAATGLIYEIVYVTAISGAVLTVERAQEGTSAQNWNIGDLAYCAPTAGTDEVTTVVNSIQAGVYNTATDAGSGANVYTGVYSPAITAYTDGMILSLQNIAHSNTGASTFNGGGGALPIRAAGGQALQGGEIVAGYDIVVQINNAGTQAELLYTSGGATPVADATQSRHAVNLETAKANFAALAGLSTQVFNVSTALTSTEATPLAQVNSLIAAYGIGFNPSGAWTNYTSSGRVLRTTYASSGTGVYTNSTSFTMNVNVSNSYESYGTVKIYEGNTIANSVNNNPNAPDQMISATIQPGATYQVVVTGGTLENWSEFA